MKYGPTVSYSMYQFVPRVRTETACPGDGEAGPNSEGTSALLRVPHLNRTYQRCNDAQQAGKGRHLVGLGLAERVHDEDKVPLAYASPSFQCGRLHTLACSSDALPEAERGGEGGGVCEGGGQLRGP